MVPETPSPIAKNGRSRGRGTWRAPQTATPAPGVGTRSQTRQREMQKREEEEAQVASARWPPSPDLSEDIVHLTREMPIRDAPRGTHAALERAYPSGEEGTGARSRQPPAAGLISRQQDTYFIPPPSRAVGGARGHSVPVSTATLGLIHRQDPALAALLREEPENMMSQRTRLRVQHHASHPNWPDWSNGVPTTMGRCHAKSRRVGYIASLRFMSMRTVISL